jgi:hypothetical protein
MLQTSRANMSERQLLLRKELEYKLNEAARIDKPVGLSLDLALRLKMARALEGSVSPSLASQLVLIELDSRLEDEEAADELGATLEDGDTVEELGTSPKDVEGADELASRLENGGVSEISSTLERESASKSLETVLVSSASILKMVEVSMRLKGPLIDL